jgi:4-hydroxybenzoyl-CoA thioesterase
MLAAKQQLDVEWGQCDPAGRVFSNQFFVWMDQGAHRLLNAAGFGPEQFRGTDQSTGFSVVAIGAEFSTLPRYGDKLELTSRITKLGNSSLRLEHDFEFLGKSVTKGYEVRVHGITANDDLKSMKAAPIPDSVRTQLAQNLVIT